MTLRLDPTDAVPLAVWPCAQTTGHRQRAGRYLQACTAHPGKMLPELARRIAAEYAPPGGLVVDPMCGIGTTLVEGAAVGAGGWGWSWSPSGPNWPATTSPSLRRMETGRGMGMRTPGASKSAKATPATWPSCSPT